MNALGIEAFLAIAKTQSLVKAAARLHLAQSTVSKRLQVLEENLGLVLVERGQGQKLVQLTPAGESFIELAERWAALQQEMRSMKEEGPRASLVLGTLDSVNFAVFPPLYRALHLHRPRIALKVITIHSAESYEYVEKRMVDMAFSFIPVSYPNVEADILYSEPMVGICFADSPIPKGRQIKPEELPADFELYNRWDAGFQSWHERWWEPHASSRITLDTSQLIMSFFHDARQWSIVPLSVARVAMRQGGFRIFRLADFPPDSVCYKLRHKTPKQSTRQPLEILEGYLADLVADKQASTAAFFAEDTA